MSKTLIGVVSFGNIQFLELCIRSFQETVTKPYDLLVVVAKPNDTEMEEFLSVRGIPHIAHDKNYGFPASLNDLKDAAFVRGDYDNLICAGNDIIAMPGAVDGMIEVADTTDWQMCCASEFDSRFLHQNYPEVRHLFEGGSMSFSDFSSRPWEVHKDVRPFEIQPNTLKDVRNLTLYKREVFDIVGYADVNYFPNGYYEDLDYAKRCNLSGIRAAGLPHCAFFHFWSRTIHAGVRTAEAQHKTFRRNTEYHVHKWGTPNWGEERYTVPFDGRGMQLTPGIFLKPDMRIADREHEAAIIKYWANL